MNSTRKSKSLASASPRAAEPKSQSPATPKDSSSLPSARMDEISESGAVRSRAMRSAILSRYDSYFSAIAARRRTSVS